MPKKIKMLIVDDEIVVRQSCIDIFSEKSDRYEISTVSSGDEALRVLKSEKYDVILTDLKMPGMPGLELVKCVKKGYPDCAVVVITGYSTVNTAVEAMKLGADDFIPKPFTPEEVFTAVEKLNVKNDR